MNQRRGIDTEKNCIPTSPNRKSPRILKNQTLNDLSNTEVESHFQLLLENNKKLENRSWVDICESEKNEREPGSVKTTDFKDDTSSCTRSRKQIAPKKSSTTPRYMRSRVKDVRNEEGLNRKRRMDRSRSSFKEEESTDIEMRDIKGSPRKKACTTRSYSASNNNDVRSKEGWAEPKLGWCKDPEVLARRSRDIERAKEKSVYVEYLEAIPKYERVKGIHPKTPNKFINYSRRSWDAQMKLWKRSLYDFFGRSPGTSCRSTPRASRDVSPVTSPCQKNKGNMEEETQNIGNTEFSINNIDPDRMASLLSKFEVDSRKKFQDGDDESTLKAQTATPGGPTSFANVI
ncbi:Histone RNA hairpin-binding protein [Strongyloides ratti]|uniref:Histone RNA hairpin-binding protein n=1 Tax=Strongyloides ratti TaxID=34506 RepID=A0A090KZ32_STRRB|nr:Histone RNA hairpin-binding protein [Strongyloides ratti]CEF62760.1 Histone RNA hairpin-binding protein [Strongyloides ratti]